MSWLWSNARSRSHGASGVFILRRTRCEWLAAPSYNDERSRRLDPVEEQYILSALELCERRSDGTYADASHNPWIRPIVQLAIETAMRRGEIFELRWNHVNLDRRTAHLPATRNGLPRTIPLSPSAIQLSRGLPRSLCGRVFPTTADDLKKAFMRGLERARSKYLADCVQTGGCPKRISCWIYAFTTCGMRLLVGSRLNCQISSSW